jgi:AcrR family transcriptional regulator
MLVPPIAKRPALQVSTCMASLQSNSKRTRIAAASVDLTKKRILVAAELVFSRDGLQGATTREIARQAGVNEVTLFRHFRTREELLRATLDQACTTFESLVVQSDEIWKDRLPRRLERYVRDMYFVVRQREALVRALASEARILPESIRRELQEFMERRKTRFAARLKQAQELGVVRKEVDLAAASDLIRDSIHSAMLRHTAYNTDPETVDTHLRGIADIFYHGIKGHNGREC